MRPVIKSEYWNTKKSVEKLAIHADIPEPQGVPVTAGEIKLS